MKSVSSTKTIIRIFRILTLLKRFLFRNKFGIGKEEEERKKNVKYTHTHVYIYKGTKVDSRDDVMAEKDLESPYDDCGRLFRTALFLEYHRFPLVLVSYRASTVPVSLNDDVTLPAAQARNRR